MNETLSVFAAKRKAVVNLDLAGRFLITIIAAFIGGMVAKKLNLPAAGMLGSMIAVAILNVATGMAYAPTDIRPFVQLTAGATIGCRLGKKDIKELKSVILPTILLILGMFAMNIVFGVVMHLLGGLDLTTALFASAPGGVSDMALIAAELGADSVSVAVLQLCRVIFIFLTIPAIFSRVLKKKEVPVAAPEMLSEENVPDEVAAPVETVAAKAEKNAKETPLNLILTVGSAAVFGLTFTYLKVTAGALIGGMLGAALLNIFTGRGFFPNKQRIYVQIGAGAFIGQMINADAVMAMGGLVIPMLIMLIGVISFTFIIGNLIHKITGLDRSICLLASTPAGVQEMALLADDLGLDAAKVSIMHTARLIVVIATFPTILGFVSTLIS